MFSTDISHFSHVLAAVQRTESLAGGEIRGLPDDRAIGGLQGLQSFALELSEAQKEFQHGRTRSALERVKRLEIQFECTVSRWDSNITLLISDIRQGKRLKNLEKLKELKAAQLSMLQLVGTARKAFQDLVTALGHSALAKARESDERHHEPSKRDASAMPVAEQDPNETPAQPRSAELKVDQAPDENALGSFLANYQFGPKLCLEGDVESGISVVPALEKDKFYFIAGVDPSRVVRVRELNQEDILVFDTLGSYEALIANEELGELIEKGVWVLVSNKRA